MIVDELGWYKKLEVSTNPDISGGLTAAGALIHKKFAAHDVLLDEME